MLPDNLPAELVERWQIDGVRPVSGGCVTDAWRVETSTGSVFVKSLQHPAPHLFEREACGLRVLRGARAVPVPEVLAVTEKGLALEWITTADTVQGRPVDEVEFGRNLAALHRHTGETFGSLDDVEIGYLGSVALDLPPCTTWAESYLERRVLPLTQQAVDEHGMDAAALGCVEKLIADPQVCGPPEPPTLVHGDLWSGNRIVDAQGRSWLIDPSAHYGHRESDLAMMRLFGGFDAACFAAYDEVFPLADGWHQRVALHQLAPLLAHVIMFGLAYEAPVMRALRSLI